MYGLGSFFTTSPREAATRLRSRCPNSSNTHLFVALVLYFREYFSISLRFTLNSKLPEPLRPPLPGLKTAVSEKEIQQVRMLNVGAFATIETIKKPKSLYPFIQSFFLPSFWLETVIVMDIQPVSSLQLHTLCAFSIKNNRNWFFIYKANGHTGFLSRSYTIKDRQKIKPWVNFHSNTTDLCIAIGITFLTNRHQNPILPP